MQLDGSVAIARQPGTGLGRPARIRSGRFGAVNWGAVMAGSTMIAIPVVIFFLIVQGRMTGGLVSGAVKG